MLKDFHTSYYCIILEVLSIIEDLLEVSYTGSKLKETQTSTVLILTQFRLFKFLVWTHIRLRLKYCLNMDLTWLRTKVFARSKQLDTLYSYTLNQNELALKVLEL